MFLSIMNRFQTTSRGLLTRRSPIVRACARNTAAFSTAAEKVDRFSRVQETVHSEIKARQSVNSDDLHDPFYVVDLSQVREQHRTWTEALPRIHPHYAVKCNPDQVLLQTLSSLGVGFDVASKGEIEMAVGAGARPDEIIYANPCKQASHLKHAYAVGVQHMTFDNLNELDKIAAHHPSAKLVLRILVDDSSSICQFGIKFGANMQMVPQLLERAKAKGMDVCGISFHVGSGCMDPTAFASAVGEAKKAFDMGANMGFNMNLLDVGGGFQDFQSPTAPKAPAFKDVAFHLGTAVDNLFPEGSGVRVIAEPGRFMAASTHTLMVNVIARRDVVNENGPSYMYYINDGVYGSFNGLMYDHATFTPTLYEAQEDTLGSMDVSTPMSMPQQTTPRKMEMRQFSTSVDPTPTYKSSLWGPTCDSLDCVVKETQLPKLEVGQWLMFRDMGAYSNAAGSEFNGFAKPSIIYMG